MQDGCVQYGGPYGAIPLASAALHVEVCHEQTVCNKCLGSKQGFCLPWETEPRHSLELIQVLESQYRYLFAQTAEFLDLHKSRGNFNKGYFKKKITVLWSHKCVKGKFNHVLCGCPISANGKLSQLTEKSDYSCLWVHAGGAYNGRQRFQGRFKGDRSPSIFRACAFVPTNKIINVEGFNFDKPLAWEPLCLSPAAWI